MQSATENLQSAREMRDVYWKAVEKETQGMMSQSGEGRIVEMLKQIQRNEAFLMEALLKRFSLTPVSDYSSTTVDCGWHEKAQSCYRTKSCLVLQKAFLQGFHATHGGCRQQVGTPSFQSSLSLSFPRKATTSSRMIWAFRSTILAIAYCFFAIWNMPFRMEIGL